MMKFLLGVLLVSSVGIIGSMCLETCSSDIDCWGVLSCGKYGTEACILSSEGGVCACKTSIELLSQLGIIIGDNGNTTADDIDVAAGTTLGTIITRDIAQRDVVVACASITVSACGWSLTVSACICVDTATQLEVSLTEVLAAEKGELDAGKFDLLDALRGTAEPGTLPPLLALLDTEESGTLAPFELPALG